MNNIVKLIGNLGQDPIIKNLENGKKLARFSVATTEKFVNKQGEQISNTQWHSIVAWDKTATIIEQFVTKGKRIGVDGKLASRVYVDANGEKRYITEIICNKVLMLGDSHA